MAFTTVLGSAATDTTTIVGTSGADNTLIQNLDSNVFVGAQQEVDTISFVNFKGLVNNYTVKGGAGNDIIGAATTSFNASFFNGNAGNDALTLTNVTSSTVQGGAGNDTTTIALLNTGFYNGNKGNDQFVSAGNVASASVFGGQGTDAFTMNGGLSTATVQGNLANDTVNIGAGAVSASKINGNAGNDTLTVTGILTGWTASTLFGGSGNDTIDVSANTATTIGVIISGDDGNDVLTGGSGGDTILTGIGTDTVSGGVGNDSITASTGVENVRFSEAGATNVDTVTGFTLGTDITAVSIAGFTVGAGDPAFSLSDGNGVDVGATAAGAFTVTTSALNATTDLTAGVTDVVFLSQAAATFAAAKGTGDLTTNAVGSNEAVLFTYFDTDTNEMVLQATFADAGGDDINAASSFLEISRTAMAQADYTIANVTASLSAI